MSIGSNDNVLTPRLTGVRVASDGAVDSGRGKPNTVISVEDCTLKFVHYYDDKGAPKSALFFVTENGQYLSTPDTSLWCGSLRNITAWMAKGVSAFLSNRAKREQGPVELPQQDSVDVLGTGEQASEAP